MHVKPTSKPAISKKAILVRVDKSPRVQRTTQYRVKRIGTDKMESPIVVPISDQNPGPMTIRRLSKIETAILVLQRKPNLARSSLAIRKTAVVICLIASYCLGADANYDLLNYHFLNGTRIAK